MNLYRSFGNLMEAWVTEGSQCLDSAWLGNNDEDPPAPSSDGGTNLRSESVDSGVETGSSVMSFPATPSSASTDNAEIDTFTAERDTFTAEREGDRLTPASTPQSPVFSSPVPSSSSSSLCLSRAQVGSTALHSKVEQALQKTDSKRQEPPTVDEMLRRRPRASFVPKRHTSELARGQRSESFGLRRTVNPSVPMRQMSDMCRRPKSMSFDMQPAQTTSEDVGEEKRTRLSPGLCYLEQVCQMLEEVARQQMHSRTLQMEMDALREHQDMEALDSCQSDCKAAAEEDLFSSQNLENTKSAEHSSSEPQRRRHQPSRHFRQRSASDTNIATLHLRKLNANCRGQHLSTDHLQEKDEEDQEEKVSVKEEKNKTRRSWKLQFGSLTREESAVRVKGQQMHSSEKNSARRRLSQLFRRKKAPPV